MKNNCILPFMLHFINENYLSMNLFYFTRRGRDHFILIQSCYFSSIQFKEYIINTFSGGKWLYHKPTKANQQNYIKGISSA